MRSAAFAVAIGLGAGRAVAVAAPPAVTAFTARDTSPTAGDTLSFECGVTSNDGTTWDPASVTVAVTIQTASGVTVQTSTAAAPGSPVVPAETTGVFVSLKVPAAQAAGRYEARATVTHDGQVVATSDAVAIVVGALHARAPVRPPKPHPLTGTVATSDQVAHAGSQTVSLDATGRYAGGRTYSAKASLSSIPGTGQPLLAVQTASTLLQVGTYSPTFDNLVLSGPSGTGVTITRNLFQNQTLQAAFLSGNHVTSNPFTIEGLSYGLPAGKGSVALTYAFARVDGDVDPSGPSFLRSGDTYGIDYKSNTGDAGGALTYELRSGVINYVDAISDRRRVDRAFEAISAFTLEKTAFTLDVVRASPFYPVITASSVTADRLDTQIGASRSFGVVSARFAVDGSQTGLGGSPTGQNAHVWNESLGLSTPLRFGDELDVNLSNAINHVEATDTVESLAQNAGLTYKGARGPISFSTSLSTATTQDNTRDTVHTITDTFDLARTVGRGLSVSMHYAVTDVLANVFTGTNINHQGSVKMTYVAGPSTFNAGYNFTRVLPYVGTALGAATGLQGGYAYRLRNSPVTVQLTETRSVTSGTTTAPVLPGGTTTAPAVTLTSHANTVTRLNVSERY